MGCPGQGYLPPDGRRRRDPPCGLPFRTFIDPKDPEDVQSAHAEQDGIVASGGGSEPFEADERRVNCLPIMEDWNYVMRLYQPGPRIPEGSWTFPPTVPVQQR